MFNLLLVITKSTGIVAVANAALRISGSRGSHLAFLPELVVSVQFIPHDPKVDWDYCCGLGGVENLWLGSHSFGPLYQSWL